MIRSNSSLVSYQIVLPRICLIMEVLYEFEQTTRTSYFLSAAIQLSTTVIGGAGSAGG